MNDCAVCRKHETLATLPGGPVHRDENIFVAHFPLIANEEAYRGHIIIELTRHLTSPAQMSENEAAAVGLWIQKMSAALELALNAEHVYVVRIGDVTPHLHFHLIPRYRGTDRAHWGPLLYQWIDKPKATADEMIAITEQLKRAIL